MTGSDTESGAPPGAGDPLTRRDLLKVAGPSIGAVAAAPRAVRASPARGRVSVADLGARGDGAADDTAAFRAALARAQVVDVPPGAYRIEAPLRIGDGQILRGAGRSGWEPYTGEGPPRSPIRTEIVVDGRLAFDARGSRNAAVAGLAIRARGARQSDWAAAPGHQPGAIGIDIAGSLQFEGSDLSFHGLEVGVSSVADGGATTQMPRIGDWIAHDCAAVIRFVSNDRRFQAVRDARIDGCLAALHCGRIVEARNCDGLRIENVRFFQCTANSMLIENTTFVSIVGATMFETGAETLVLRGCSYVTMTGAQVVRAGFYHPKPLIQRSAIVLENCADVSFHGLVEQPVGRAFTIRDCANLSITAAVGTPYWSMGNLAGADGAVRIERSRAVVIDASFSGSSYWIAVWADAASASSIGGRIATEGTVGVVRCTQLQPPPWGHVARTSAPVIVPANGTVRLDELRILVPPGRSLVTCSVELTSGGLAFEAAGRRWRPESPAEPGGGSISLERGLLHRNDSTEARYAAVPIGVHNPGPAPVRVPAGHELRLSLALE